VDPIILLQCYVMSMLVLQKKKNPFDFDYKNQRTAYFRQDR